MKKTIVTLFSLFCFAAVPVVAEQVPNTLTPEEKTEGFQLLFDGEKLAPDIWQSSIEGYPVRDGAFVCEKGGNLLTKKEYGDFVLRFEFALPAGGNNGVGIRAESPSKDAAYDGMEIQILDNSADKYKQSQPWQYHGSIYGVVPAKRNAEKNDFLKQPGEWNVQEITACGSRITVVLNGEIILDTDISKFKTDPTPDGKEHPGLHREKGFLGFLGHGDPVRFRNVRVKELNALTEEEQKDGFTLLFDGKTLSKDVWGGDVANYAVENGVIVCKGEHMSTKEKYENFIFRFEFKLTPGGNNGIGFRLPTAPASGAIRGFECQILDNTAEKYKNLKPYQFHGSIYYVIPAKRNPEKNDHLKPLGEWNYMELTNIGSLVKVVVNDGVLVEANLDDHKDMVPQGPRHHRPKGFDRTDGHVGFQGHQDPVEFRNVRIKKVQ